MDNTEKIYIIKSSYLESADFDKEYINILGCYKTKELALSKIDSLYEEEKEWRLSKIRSYYGNVDKEDITEEILDAINDYCRHLVYRPKSGGYFEINVFLEEKDLLNNN